MDFAYILSRAVAQGLPLLFGSNGEILNEKSGNLNLGIPGIMISGGVAGIVGALVYENSTATPNGFVGLLVSMLCSVSCSLVIHKSFCCSFFVFCDLVILFAPQVQNQIQNHQS